MIESGWGSARRRRGGGRFSPWYNAPPGTVQRLGVFYLLTRGDAGKALAETLRYTHGDRFVDLPGHVTFTSHWHMAIAMAAMKELEQKATRTTPDFVKMFKDMNINIVHLGEFHGDGHQFDPGPLRFPELRRDLRRVPSLVGRFLADAAGRGNFGHPRRRTAAGSPPVTGCVCFPGRSSGHSSVPRASPSSRTIRRYGTIYRVGGRDDMFELLKREHGLAWTSHPRIKASSWTPDSFKDEAFYRSDQWLGAAWKAMPVDLSRPRLGERGARSTR